MSLNLGNAQDFAKATQGAIGATAGLAQLFGGGIEDWDIQEASYISNSSKEKGKNAEIFHVFESNKSYGGELSDVQDQGGRRKITYLFPYVDGQTTDDLGRDAETISLNVFLHGSGYLTAYKKLFRELNKPEPGTLVHPVRGPIECVLKDFTITHKSDARRAMTLSLQFIEHNFTVGDLQNIIDDPTVKSALSKAMQVLNDINNAITNIRGAIIFASTLKSRILAAIEAYKNTFTSLLNIMNKTFNEGTSNDLPGLVPLNDGGVIDDNGNRVSDIFTVAQSPNDPFINISQEDLDPDIVAAATILQIEQQVNASREEINSILILYEEDPTNQAVLEFHEDIVNLKASAIALQEVLESGKKSSNVIIINYEVPRVMSIREAMFINGVSLTRLKEVEVLNNELNSFNYIEKGTVLRIPK